jgi:hypothetical protein
MYQDLPLTSVLLPAIVVIGIASTIVTLRIRRQPDGVQKAIAKFKLLSASTGLFVLVLWFLLPSATLSSFGFPRFVDQIEKPERLLAYLQEYNRALVRTSEVLYWFIFAFVWWFLAGTYSIVKSLGAIEKTAAVPTPA